MEDFVFVKTGVDYQKILFGEILYVKGARNYVHLVTQKKTYLARFSMNHVEELLRVYEFCRIHKRYIISLQYITSFDQKSISMGNHLFPVGRQYKEVFKQKLISLDKKVKTLPTHFDGDIDKLLKNI